MVELASDGKGGYRVERYSVEILPRDVVADGNIVNLESAAETVRRAWKKLSTSTRLVAVALPASHVITKKIIVAAGLREEELEVQVETEANQYIPFPLDDVNLDYQIIGPAPSMPDEVEVLIAASKKERVEDRVAAAEASGLKVLVVEKAERFGGTSAISGGAVWIHDSDQARKKAAGGSPQEIETYLRTIIGEPHYRQDLVDAFIASGREALAFLEKEGGGEI